MPSLDLYRVLQVHPTAEPEVIQAAFRRLARKYHPDAGSGSDERMAELNAAYAVLGDATRRAAYDRLHGSDEPGPPVASAASSPPSASNPPPASTPPPVPGAGRITFPPPPTPSP